MTKFMQGLLLQSQGKKSAVGGEAIPLVHQAMIGDNREVTIELGFAEHVGQNGDEEIVRRNAQEFRPVLAVEPGGNPRHGREDRGGIVLEPLNIIAMLDIQWDFPNAHGHPEGPAYACNEIFHQIPVGVRERSHLDQSQPSRFSPYFSIL